MNRQPEAILSSTGRLGVSRRSYDRLYVNGTQYSTNPYEFAINFSRLIQVAERHPSRISRCVFRGLVNEDIMRHISNNGLQSHLEVALPIREFNGDNSWLIYLAFNRQDRRSNVPHGTMIEATSNLNKEIVTPLERIQALVEQGYTFIRYIFKDQVDEVYSLWGETFGWERQEVVNLRRRLIAAYNNPSSQKDVWFSGLVNKDGMIVSVAMAERISIPSSSGPLDLVESTEWRTKDGYEGRKLMTATLCALNAQILYDLKNKPHGLPLIYAECNFQSRADRAGYGAGMRIPERTNGYYAPQILVQNVLVRDGQPVGEGKLRDFIFLYLPVKVIQNYYNPIQVESIMSMIKA